MIGAQVKNNRRTDGPTAERLLKAQGGYSIGDDKQGTRIYHFHDAPLERLYSRLVKRASSYQEQQIRKEYIALQKFKNHWAAAGLQAPLGSADLGRIFASDPTSMSGMAKTERQAYHRTQFRAAVQEMGLVSSLIVQNFVCYEYSIEESGLLAGFKSRSPERSRRYAGEMAERRVRDSGDKLSSLWGVG